MKYLTSLFLMFFVITGFSQEETWVKTEAEITEITQSRGKRIRERAVVKFELEDGTEQFGSAELFRIPFIGSMYDIGDNITINYNANNPAIVETVLGKFISSYGMYILILLGIIFSIKPLLKLRKGKSKT
ncbi:DUF3592 domain-containing protein [Crocinitomix catalasitica]|uniref:DUF3592 domain-containing protein n=1 Tax=Crocinitomix catalasitica TaxID=184607 RepID=UPI0012FA278A|nr:DUF3592 domain-containing protein [Crocinitomix catalasitica]